MPTQLLQLKTGKIQGFYGIFKNDPVFSLSLILAVLSCFFIRPRLSCVNFEVLACLFNLMIVVKAFEELRLLDKFAVSIINRCADSRRASLVMILLSFFSSMAITNDISLITLVPLTLIIGRKSGMDVLATVILQTLAANIGSSLTPIGNPQNLFIFSYYRLTAPQFFAPVALFVVLGLLWLLVLNLARPRSDLNAALEPIAVKDGRRAAVWAAMLAVTVLSVFSIIDYRIAFLLTVTVAMLINRDLFGKVDYRLLITFICFFIFIGNISGIPAVSNFAGRYLGGTGSTYLGSILLSQLISNVPCSVFLSGFTSNWRELLLGVNIGGMGTIIASLASVISYKLFIAENPESGRKYILKFSIYNVSSLVLFTFAIYFLAVRK